MDTRIESVEIIDVDGDPISKCVGISHRLAGQKMATHLLDRGHRRFDYIGSALDTDLRAAKRRDAFLGVLTERGLGFDRVITSNEPSSMLLGRNLTEEILRENNEPIALYYSNDDLASGGLLQCLAKGLALPKDVAIASFNGLEFLAAMPMQITTFQSPRYEIGQIAGRYMLGDMQDQIMELAGNLIPGQTI